MKITDNYKKHTSKNPVQKFLLGNFYNSLITLIKETDCFFLDFARDRNDGKRIHNDEKGGNQHYSINSILDAGCGEGFTLNKIYEAGVKEGLEGIDGSEEAISIGRKIHPHLSLKQGNIYKLPYKNNSFDMVLSTEVLEHLEYPQEALKKLIRVSKKYVLLSVPNEPWFRLANFLRGKNLSRFGNDIDHINHWSSKSFREFIQKEKVRILIVRRPFPWIMCLMEKI